MLFCWPGGVDNYKLGDSACELREKLLKKMAGKGDKDRRATGSAHGEALLITDFGAAAVR